MWSVCHAGVVIVMFQQCPPLQSTLLEEVLTQVLPCLPVGKRCRRNYVIGDTKSASIQTVVAMLVQMIQVHSGMSPEFMSCLMQ